MGQLLKSNEQAPIAKSANYTITVADIRAGKVIVVDTTSGDITLTLPELSTLPDDSRLHSFAIGHEVGSNDVIVATHSGDTFVYGNTSFNLGSGHFHFTMAGIKSGASERWGLQRNLTVAASGHRDASWASSNFSSMTVVPFDSEAYNNQSELLVYTSGAAARYTVLDSGRYKISFQIDIDSTGGSTWNAEAHVYKNGSAVESLQARTGNYGAEDQSMSCIPSYVDLNAGDYIDLRIDQNNLTGNLVHAMLNIEIRL